MTTDVTMLNRLNRCLPYGEDLIEPDLTIAEVLEDLKASVHHQEEGHAHPDETNQAYQDHYKIGTHLKRLDRCLRLKTTITQQELSEFLQFAYKLTLDRTVAPMTQVKLYNSVSTILRWAKLHNVYAEDMVLDWRPLLVFLEEVHIGDEENSQPALRSSGVESPLRASFVSMLHALRHYYGPQAGEDILALLMPDLDQVSNTRAFRALALMLVFLPSRLPPGTYDRLLPQWVEIWQRIDRCPDWDAAWLTLFCRARKQAESFPWKDHIAVFYTHLMSTFSIPFGMTSAPETREFPSRYRFLFSGGNPLLRLRRPAKLIIFLLGRGPIVEVDVVVRPDLPNAAEGQVSTPLRVSQGTKHLMVLFSSIRSYFNPSNAGMWTEELAYFLTLLSYNLAKRLGFQLADEHHHYVMSPFHPLEPPEVTAVIRTVVPLAQQNLYSKKIAAVSSAEQTLKTLAFIAPHTVARLTLPLLLSALDPSSLTTTHQAPAALKALSVLVLPLMKPRPLLLDTLPTFLQWSLPGVDSNDVLKTMATLAFYNVLTSVVPIRADVSQVEPPPVLTSLRLYDDDEESRGVDDEPGQVLEKMQSLAPIMVDWALSLLERIFAILLAKESPKSGHGAEPKQNNSRAELGLAALIRLTSRRFFNAMDASMHAMTTDKLLTFLTSHTLPDAAKECAYLLETCCFTRPETALKKIIPALADINPAKEPARKLAWRLRLLAGSVRRSFGAIVPYIPKLLPLITASVDHEDKLVRKSGGKLLRRCLQALTDMMLRDIELGDSPADPHLANLGASWYVPGQAELRAAMGLVKKFIISSMEVLEEDAEDGTSQGSSQGSIKEMEERWRRRLKLVFSGLRGVIGVMYDLPGHLSDDTVVKNGSRLILSRADDETRDFLVALRPRLATFLHGLLPFITGEKFPSRSLSRDVKVMKTWCKIAVLIMTGGRSASLSGHAYVAKQGLVYFKSSIRDVVSKAYRMAAKKHACRGHKKDPNAPDLPVHLPLWMLTDRIYIHHLVRANEASYAIPKKIKGTEHEVLYANLISDAIRLSAYNISTVRAAAQRVVESVSGRYGSLLRAHLPELISYLTLEGTRDKAGTGTGGADGSDPQVIHEHATAATYILRQSGAIRQIASRWNLTEAFLRAMSGSWQMVAALAKDKQETMSGRLFSLNLRYVSFWHAAEIRSHRRREQYMALMDDMLNQLQPADGSPSLLHWRYQLLVSWQLLHLLRPDVDRPVAVWRWFLQALKSGDGQPLQKLALAGLFRLTAFQLPPSPPNTIVPSNGEDDFVVLPDPVADLINDEEDETSSLIDPEIADALCEPTLLKVFCLALAHDHPQIGDNPQMGLRNMPLWSAGVEDLLRDAQRRKGVTIPFTRLALMSRTFLLRHAQLIRQLLRCVGPRLVRPLIAAAQGILEGMPAELELVFYGTVGEVISGIISEYSRADVSEVRRARMWEAVLPVVDKVLPKLSLDYSTEWCDALRYATMHRDPRHLEPLTSFLVSRVLSSLESQPGDGVTVFRHDYTSQAKCLRLLDCVLIEFFGDPNSRKAGLAVSTRILPTLLSALGHPYKMCRDELGRAFFITYGLGMMPLEGAGSISVDVVDHMRSLTLVEGDTDVNNLTSATAIMTIVSDQEQVEEVDLDMLADAAASSVLGSSTKDKKRQQELTRRKETVLQWVYRSVSRGDLRVVESTILALLPVAFECARDYDVELADMAKTMLRYFARALWWSMARPLASLASGAGPQENETNVACLLRLLLQLSEHKSWYVRLEAIVSLSVFQIQHLFLLTSSQSSAILARVIASLTDERREVQEKAQSTLSQIVYSMELGKADQLTQEYLKKAGRTITSKRRKKTQGGAASATTELSAEATTQRAKVQQTCARLLSAVVLAYPYEVPSYVPQALAVLSRLLNSSISSTLQEVIRKTVSEFKRTHTDEWETNHRRRFTEEQLDALSDVLSSPHYYA